MDRKAIETLSVNAVRDSVVVSDFLDQFIADNDKEPTWDGFVYITTSTKSPLFGMIFNIIILLRKVVSNFLMAKNL